MQNLPLFPRAVRLVLYAGTAVASLASVPTIIKHAEKAVSPITEDDNAPQEASAPTTSSPAHEGTISIQPVGSQTALHRQAELAQLRIKVANTRPAD